VQDSLEEMNVAGQDGEAPLWKMSRSDLNQCIRLNLRSESISSRSSQDEVQHAQL
jgi:hypothetical protein